MDKHTIQQELHNILTEEIPDDMNILPDIHKQLQKQSKPSIRPMMGFARVAIVIAVFIMVGAGGYALYQRNIIVRDIPQQIITDINEMQSIEGVDVTLNWAYADANRIVVAYSMEYQPTDDFINAPIVTLSTSDGVIIPQEFGGGGGGGGGKNQPTISESLTNYDASVIEGTPDTLDLVLTLDFSADAIQSNPIVAHMSGGGGGGGSSSGGGSGGSASTGGGGGGNPPIPTPDISKIIDRVYTFEFSLPFFHALQVEPLTNTVESNGITMTVNNIRYTPSLTKFDICYNMPDNDLWGVQMRITTDSPDSPFYSRQLRPIESSANSDLSCFEANATAAIPDDTEEFSIDVLFLSQPIMPLSDELARSEEAYFADLGYSIEIDADPNGYSMDILDYPDDMDELEAQGFVRANLFFKRYEGDWTFTVPLK